MIISLDGLRVKLVSLYKNHKEEILAWVIFSITLLITFVAFNVINKHLKGNFYNRSVINSRYSVLSNYDASLKQIVEADFTNAGLDKLEQTLKDLKKLREQYQSLRLEPHAYLDLGIVKLGYDVKEFNGLIDERLKVIGRLEEKLFKYKVYVFSVNAYKKFDACIKHLDFSKSDINISTQLNKCIAPVNIAKIKEYSKVLNCEELEKLADYFNAYKSLSRYYYFLSQKRYKEAQKYKEEARKRINVNIKWEKCFDFLGK